MSFGHRLVAAGLIVVAVALRPPAARADSVVGSNSYAQAPALFFGDSGSVADNVGYTTEPAEPVGSSTGCDPLSPAITRTAWWRITGTGSSIALNTRASNFNTVLAVYDAPGGTPIMGNRIACNDNEPGFQTSALSFPSTRGKSYLLQVGSNGPDHGRIGLSASSATRPANDDRASALTLQTGQVSSIDNAGASQERGETLACASTPFAATVWFKWAAPALGSAVFSSTSASGDTVITVYRASDGAALGCDAAGLARVALPVASGSGFLIQVGTKGADDVFLPVGTIVTKVDLTVDPDADNDGEPASTDCDDSNPSIRHGLVDIPDDGIDQNCDGVDAVNLDRDNDGSQRPQDCNDADPRVHPGAVDIPENGVDEDCNGRDAPYPMLATQIHATIGYVGARHRHLGFTSASADAVPKASEVVMTCAGRGCHRHRLSRAGHAPRMNLIALVRGVRMVPGTRVELRVTKAGTVGRAARWVVSKHGSVKTTPLCVHPGRTRATKCP